MRSARSRTVLRIFFPLLAVLLLVGCSKETPSQPRQGGAAAAPAQRPPASVEVFAVEQRSLRESLLLVGSLMANESAEVRAEIAGRVEKVLFEEGQVVVAGAPLIQLDASELRAQLASTRASLALAESNLQRVRPLAEGGTLSQSDLDRARADYDKAVADVSLLEVRLDRMVLRAPFNGVVGARMVSPGDYLTTASLVTTVDDLSQMKVEFDVPEAALAQLKVGSRFTVQSRSLPTDAAFEGEVFFVSPALDRSTRSSLIRGLVREPKTMLKPGMFVMVDLTLAVREQALVVPESAILARQGGFAVVVAREKDGGKVVEIVPVRLGVRERGIVEILPIRGGIEAGTEVVASGVGSLILIPGDRIAPKPLNPRLAPAPAA